MTGPERLPEPEQTASEIGELVV